MECISGLGCSYIPSLSQSLVTDVELQQQLQTTTQHLARKEAELTRAEETIRREQQQIQEMGETIRREQQLVQAKDRELAMVQQQLRQQGETIRRGRQLVEAKDRELAQAQQQLRQLMSDKDEIIQFKERELAQAQHQLKQLVTEKDGLVQAKDRELAQAQQQMWQQEQSSRREIGDLKQQLQSSEAIVAEFLKTLQQRDSELKTLKSNYNMQLSRPGPSVTAAPHSIPHYKPRKLTVQCRGMKTAPCEMMRGSAASGSQYAYFMPSNSHAVHRYEWSTEKWDELPPCPYRDSGLVIIDGALTAVGGYDGFGYTNKLFTLRQGKWVDELPPMKTACSQTASISTSDGNYIFAVGGYNGGGWTTVVDVFQMRSRRWSEITDLHVYLPQPLSHPSATICGNHIHAIGRDGNGFSCSLQDLLTTSPSRSHSIPWSPLPLLPMRYSTAATLCGQLVLVGGMRDWSSVNSIHQLVDGQWVEIGSMTSSRRWRLVVSPSPDKMMIVGGQRAGASEPFALPTDSVEECVVVH